MVLSRDCDGCEQLQACQRRYDKVDGIIDRRVFCPDGTPHLVDYGSQRGVHY